MKAARLYGPKDVRIDDVPPPEPDPGEVLVRVHAVSICPSDWRLYDAGHASGTYPDHPMIQGHEFSGEVAALGEGVTGPPVGTRVAVEPTWHCGECDLCRQGLTNVCRDVVFPSFPQRDGALAEYIACPAHAVCPLPEGVSYDHGALVEPLGVALHAVRLAKLTPESRIAVLGAGAIGVCLMMVARAYGVRDMTVVEPIRARRELAAQLGADPLVESCEELTAGCYEADLVFECSGDPQAIGQAMELTRPAGTVMVVGIPHPDEVTFDSSLPRRRELTLIFSRRSRNTLKEAVALVAARKIDLQLLPTRHFALEETAAALEATNARPGDMLRAIVTP